MEMLIVSALPTPVCVGGGQGQAAIIRSAAHQ
jgi:hypothetical protein